jgi:hypothetical protein
MLGFLHVACAFICLKSRTGCRPETEFDADPPMALTTKLGSVMLGPPGTKPSDLAKAEGA